MRKFLILAATAASALAVATPAAAQWYPPQQHNGYGYNGYGNNGYGYNDYAGNLGYRINRLQQHINQFDSRNIISNREARSLRAQAYDLERQLRYGQGYNVERRLAQLEQRVDYIASRSYGRYNNRGWNGDHNNWNRDDRNWRDHDDRDDD